jgi:hypothetical protein
MKNSVYSKNPHTLDDMKIIITEHFRNVDRPIQNTVSRTQFGMSINVSRLAGDSLNVTCNFLYCNYHVDIDF